MIDSAQVAALDTVEDCIDDLWFLLHHSDDEDGLVLGLTCYLDDSGSDDGSPLVTCGGPVVDRINFKHLSRRWNEMYAKYKDKFFRYTLEPPLHMSDFTGTGKYAGLLPEFKRTLFLDVVRIINDHKLYSISVAVSQDDYKNELSEDVRKTLIGPYAFAFFAVVAAHQRLSELLISGPIKASYLVDSGFGHYAQLVEAHKVIVGFEKALGGFRHTGALATDSDDRVPTLQAADVIAWSSRMVERNGVLPEGFEPLAELLLGGKGISHPHATIPIPRDGIRMFADPVKTWIANHGTVPLLTDVISRMVDGVSVKIKA